MESSQKISEESLPSKNWWEDEEVIAELDERVERWEKGIDRGYTWEEVEQGIEELKLKRAAKTKI